MMSLVSRCILQAGLRQPLKGWRQSAKGEMETSLLMATLKELHAEKKRLMDNGKTQEEEEEEGEEEDSEEEDEEEEEDDDDDDDDDEDDEEEV